MCDTLDLKIRQMHAALAGLTVGDVSTIRSQIISAERCVYAMVDFNQNSDPIALANAASLLIANIASIKDHLKSWCKKQNVQFQGDALFNSNMAVALVHDLWNTDKHAELSSRPRSGHKPRLKNLRTALRISAGTAPGAFALFQMDPRTGQPTTSTSGGGSVQLALVAEVVDESGNELGDFTLICTQAVEAWSNALSAAGVPLP